MRRVDQCHQVGDRHAACSGCHRGITFTYLVYCQLYCSVHCNPTTVKLTGFTRFGEVTSERAEHTKFHIKTETFNHANRADEGDHSYAINWIAFTKRTILAKDTNLHTITTQ